MELIRVLGRIFNKAPIFALQQRFDSCSGNDGASSPSPSFVVHVKILHGSAIGSPRLENDR